MSILAPNYTQIPNIIIDEWLDKLSGLQLKVLMIICRKTIGWHKLTDRISLSQLVNLLKSSRSHINDAIKALIGYGLIKKEAVEYKETIYELNIKKIHTSAERAPPTSAERAPTKETGTKESSSMKSIDYEETMPFSSKRNVFVKTGTTKFPLKKDQWPIFQKLKESNLGTDDETLMILVRIYQPEQLERALEALECEIRLGTKIRNRAGFFRAVLDGKIKNRSGRSDDNRRFVKDYLKVNPWPSLEIKKDYIIDTNTHEDIIFDLPSENFIRMMVALHEKSEIYN